MNRKEFKKYLQSYTIQQLKEFYRSVKSVNNFLPQEISDEWRVRGLIIVLHRTIVERGKIKPSLRSSSEHRQTTKQKEKET